MRICPFIHALLQHFVGILLETVPNKFDDFVRVNTKSFHRIDRALFQVVLLGGLGAVLVKMVHVVPPLIGVLLVNEIFAELLLDKDLAGIFYPTENHLFAVTLVVVTVSFTTVSAGHCRIVYCQVH